LIISIQADDAYLDGASHKVNRPVIKKSLTALMHITTSMPEAYSGRVFFEWQYLKGRGGLGTGPWTPVSEFACKEFFTGR
jgi:hypothetical protein